MKTYSFDSVKDKYLGNVGTPKRDNYEAQLKFELGLEQVGETIREIRKQQDLTQEELGQRIGVGKAQISKLENGSTNMTIDTMMRVFNGLNTKINFNIEVLA